NGDYGHYHITSDQYQPNYYYDPSLTNIISSRIYSMLAPTDIDIYSVKADYEQNFKKGRLGFGGKSSYVQSDNDFDRYDVVASEKRLDTVHSNYFRYRENINAGYVNYNKQFKGILVQEGVRVE